jgi:hypothetical protein
MRLEFTNIGWKYCEVEIATHETSTYTMDKKEAIEFAIHLEGIIQEIKDLYEIEALEE